ncbi:MAG: DUF2269 family protein [Thermoplasmatota archaeon]
MVDLTAIYNSLKLIHIVSAIFLIGNWASLAIWKVTADRSGDSKVIAQIADRIYRIDRKVTTPVAIVAFAAGYGIIRPLGFFGGLIAENGWAIWGLICFFLALAIWFFGMRPLEVRMADLADGSADRGENPSAEYRRMSVVWLGLVALAIILGLVAGALMVFKPVLWPATHAISA